jgi:CRP/FNR family transcriptional regulator, cyclic AMP receptor protein
MDTAGALGKLYQDGDVIVRQGDPGDCMYIVQQGQVEVVSEREGNEFRLALLGEGEFFGEMAIFERKPRSATVRAKGQARVLSVDRKNFLGRIHDDPSIAYRLVQTMSKRIRDLDEELARCKREG